MPWQACAWLISRIGLETWIATQVRKVGAAGTTVEAKAGNTSVSEETDQTHSKITPGLHCLC